MGNVNNYSVEEILDHLDGLIHHAGLYGTAVNYAADSIEEEAQKLIFTALTEKIWENQARMMDKLDELKNKIGLQGAAA